MLGSIFLPRHLCSGLLLLCVAGATIGFGEESLDRSVLHSRAFSEDPNLTARSGSIVVLDPPSPGSVQAPIRYTLSGGRHELCRYGDQFLTTGFLVEDAWGQEIFRTSGEAKCASLKLEEGIYTLRFPNASGASTDAGHVSYVAVDPINVPLTDATGDALSGFWAVQPDPNHDPDAKHRDGRLRSFPLVDPNEPNPSFVIGGGIIGVYGMAVIADYGATAIDQFALFRLRYGALPDLAAYYPSSSILDIFGLDPGGTPPLPWQDSGAMIVGVGSPVGSYTCPSPSPFSCWFHRSHLQVQDLGQSQFEFQFEGKPFYYYGYYPSYGNPIGTTSYPNLTSRYFNNRIPPPDPPTPLPPPPITKGTGPFRLLFRFFDDGKQVGQLQHGEIALFESCHFAGRAIVLEAAEADLLKWNSATVGLEKLGKSIRLGNNTALLLYPGAGFSGTPLTVKADQACLAEQPVPASVTMQPLTAFLAASPDCPNCLLNGVDLTGFNLAGADLTGAQLNSAILTNAKLNGAHLAGASFTAATLSCTDFSGSDPNHLTDLTHTTLMNIRVIPQEGCRPNFSYTSLEARLLPLPALRFLNLSGASIADLKGNPLSTLTQPLDLTGAMMPNALLDGIGLAGANLTNAKLNGAHLADADFNGATLSCTDFSGSDAGHLADLTRTPFVNVKVISQEGCRPNFSYTRLEARLLPLPVLRLLNLSGVSIADLKGNPLSSAAQPLDLTGAMMPNALLDGIGLESANLTEAALNYASLRAADLANAKLYSAQLSNSNLDGASLTGAFLTKGSGTVAANVQGAFLRNVNLSQAQLSGANFSNANFYGTVAVGNGTCAPDPNTGFTDGCATAAAATMNATIFSDAYLFGVDFTRATAQGVLFDNAFLSGSNFSGSTLSASSSGADTGFSGAFLQGVNMLGVTLQNGISLDNAFVDFTDNGNTIALVLNGFHTAFAGYWGTKGQPVCAELVYNQPTVPPRTTGHVTCPNGSRNLKGCGPPCPNNSSCNWKSAVDLTSFASYAQDATYTPAPSSGNQICSADLKWIPLDFSSAHPKRKTSRRTK